MFERLKLLIAVIGLSVSASANYAAEKVVVAQSNEVMIWAPMYVARGMGYFKEEGLDVEVTLVKSGPDALTAVMTGSANVTLGFPATPISAVIQGHDIQIFGVLASQFMAQLMLDGEVAERVGVTAQTPINERIAKLKGLSIATNAAGSAYDYLIRSVVTGAGLKPEEDVVTAPIGAGPAAYAALERKRVDGIITTSPTDRMAERGLGAFRLIDFTAGDYAPTDGLIYISLNASGDWLENNPETAASMLRALGRALALMQDDPDTAKRAVRPFFESMGQQVFDDSWETNLPAYSKSPVVKSEGLMKVLDLMEIMNGAPVIVELDDIYTNAYTERAGFE